jgi:hypothetical protein
MQEACGDSVQPCFQPKSAAGPGEEGLKSSKMGPDSVCTADSRTATGHGPTSTSRTARATSNGIVQLGRYWAPHVLTAWSWHTCSLVGPVVPRYYATEAGYSHRAPPLLMPQVLSQ